jgi:hypothetical protein
MEEKKRFIMIPFQVIYSDSIYGVTSNNKFFCESLPSKILIKFDYGLLNGQNLCHIFINP